MHKNSIIFVRLVIIAFSLIVALPSNARDFRWEKKITGGIDYVQIKKFVPHGRLLVHILKIDMKRSDIDIKPALAKDTIGKLEPIPNIAKRNNAVAAINGSFFDARRSPHLPIGIISIDGKTVNKSTLSRCAFGITAGKDIIIGVPNIKSKVVLLKKDKSFDIWGINRPRKNDEVILYTSEYGERTKTNNFGIEIIVKNGKVSSINRAKGNSKIPKGGYVVSLHGVSRKYADWLLRGEDILVEFDLGEEWEMVNHMVSGGPLLIENGKMVVKKTVIEEIFKGKLLKRSARTAIGETKDKKLMLVVVDKRRGISDGAFYSELSKIMIQEGAWRAMGLDGGGSSSMFVDGKVVSYPTAWTSIPVSNAIIVKKKGYRYIAKKPRPISKPPPIEKITTPEVVVLVETVSEETVYPDGLFEIYNQLIKVFSVTGEVGIGEHGLEIRE